MGKLSYQPGAEILAEGEKAIIIKNVNMDEVLVKTEGHNKHKTVHRRDISALPDNKPSAPIRDAIALEDLEEADKRLEIIRHLVGLRVKGRADIEKAGREIGISASTIYRWIAEYEDSGTLASLAPRRKQSQKGQKRLTPEVEAIVEGRIQNNYLKRQRITKTKLYQLVKTDCKNAGYNAPGYATICRRVNEISQFEETKKRRGPKQALERFGSAPDTYDEAQFPLSVVQIDHTQLNIFVVDSEERKSIGRPWITLAIDVYSRMITGLYLSMDPPSANSVGLCLLNSILEKYDYLKSIDIDGQWPVWGLMHVLHCDNAKEFRGKMLQEFCKEWGITLQWRAVGKPAWGAHIERMNGTLKSFLDAQDGTTFRGPQDRREYDSEDRAIFTLDELERLLVTHIVNVYHQNKHKTLNLPPIKAWEKAIFEDHGCGMPEPVSNTEKLRLELLPMEQRSVQRDGISWDNITYFDNCLRPWIKAKEKGKTRKFIVRRDPRDISHIYFFDPNLKEYLKVPYRKRGHPVISLWDLRAARKRLDEMGRKTKNEDIIFHAYEEIEHQKEVAKKKTKKVRKATEQKKRDKKSLKKIEVSPKASEPKPKPPKEMETIQPPTEEEYFDLSDDDLKPDFQKW